MNKLYLNYSKIIKKLHNIVECKFENDKKKPKNLKNNNIIKKK